jgi:hypothetical protein
LYLHRLDLMRSFLPLRGTPCSKKKWIFLLVRLVDNDVNVWDAPTVVDASAGVTALKKNQLEETSVH